LVLSVAWAAAVVLSGCGGSLAQIGGKVTHRGEAVAGAEVVVESAADSRLQYFGRTREDGSLYVGYRDKPGLPVGRCKIRVTHYTLRDGKPLPSGEAGRAVRESNKSIGRIFLFEQDLANGKNVLDLKLEAAADVRWATREP
jgi:hypothetical protein